VKRNGRKSGQRELKAIEEEDPICVYNIACVNGRLGEFDALLTCSIESFAAATDSSGKTGSKTTPISMGCEIIRAIHSWSRC
jgi:hypothetical protein